MTRQRGFTMTEMLAALGIAAVVLSVAAPSLSSMVANNRTTAASNSFVASLHLARREAIKRNARVTLCPSSDGHNCGNQGWNKGWLIFVDRNSDRVVDGGEPLVAAFSGTGATRIPSDVFVDRLVYRPDGRAMTDSPDDNIGSFFICNAAHPERSREIHIDLTGRPRTSEPDNLSTAKRLCGRSA